MTIPDVFKETWERTGDLKAAISAVKQALRGDMPIRPALPGVKLSDASWFKARRIVAAIAEDSEVPLARVLGADRSAVFSLPRQVAMLMIRHLLMMSYPDIGKVFGGRDHTTILHGCKSAEVWLSSRPATLMRVRALAEAAIADADERRAA